MSINAIGVLFTVSAVIMIGRLLFQKTNWSHPVMFCNYSLLSTGLGLSVFESIKDIAFAFSIILALICVCLLPTKAALESSNEAISQLKEKGEPVSLFGLLVSELRKKINT